MASKIIIADDEEEVIESYKRYLAYGFKRVIAEGVSSGEELTEKLFSDYSYDFVITDNNMNNQIDGIKVVRKIRDFNRIIPVYVFGGNGDSEIEKQVLDSGANKYASKTDAARIFELIHEDVIPYLKNAERIKILTKLLNSPDVGYPAYFEEREIFSELSENGFIEKQQADSKSNFKYSVTGDGRKYLDGISEFNSKISNYLQLQPSD